nr:ERAP1-like C-terminal domain-containing protein [Actinomycetota bacterium]
ADWVAFTSAVSLGQEGDPDVWAAALGALHLVDLIVPEADRAAFQEFVRGLVGPAFARLGWAPAPGEPQRDGTARARLISALGILGNDPGVQAEATRRHASYLSDHSGLSPDVLSAAVNVMVASGSTSGYEAARQAFLQAATPQDQVRYLNALGASRDVNLLAETLEMCLTSDVRSQDAPYLIATILASRVGSAMTWSWMKQHWQALIERFPQNTLIRMLEGIAGVTDPALAMDVHVFLASHPLPIGGPRVAQLEERMDITVALAARIGSTVADALR